MNWGATTAAAASDFFSPSDVAERDLERWQEELALLKAHLAVQEMALRALVRSHPRPAAVHEAWQQLRADKVAAAYALSADGPTRDWLTARSHALAEEWTAELAEAAERPPVPQDAAAS